MHSFFIQFSRWFVTLPVYIEIAVAIAILWIALCFVFSVMNALVPICKYPIPWTWKAVIASVQAVEFIVFSAVTAGAACVPLYAWQRFGLDAWWSLGAIAAVSVGSAIFITFKWGNEVETRLRPIEQS